MLELAGNDPLFAPRYPEQGKKSNGKHDVILRSYDGSVRDEFQMRDG